MSWTWQGLCDPLCGLKVEERPGGLHEGRHRRSFLTSVQQGGHLLGRGTIFSQSGPQGDGMSDENMRVEATTCLLLGVSVLWHFLPDPLKGSGTKFAKSSMVLFVH